MLEMFLGAVIMAVGVLVGHGITDATSKKEVK